MSKKAAFGGLLLASALLAAATGASVMAAPSGPTANASISHEREAPVAGSYAGPSGLNVKLPAPFSNANSKATASLKYSAPGVGQPGTASGTYVAKLFDGNTLTVVFAVNGTSIATDTIAVKSGTVRAQLTDPNKRVIADRAWTIAPKFTNYFNVMDAKSTPQLNVVLTAEGETFVRAGAL